MEEVELADHTEELEKEGPDTVITAVDGTIFRLLIRKCGVYGNENLWFNPETREYFVHRIGYMALADKDGCEIIKKKESQKINPIQRFGMEREEREIRESATQKKMLR